MLEALYNLFKAEGPLSLSGDIWLIAMIAIVAVAFLASLIIGLIGGTFNRTKSVMKNAMAKPNNAIASIKLLPANAKALYKNARMGNIKPSVLVTKQVCVDEPYKRSLLSKVWLVTLIATIVCGLMAFFVMPLQALPKEPVGELTEEMKESYFASVAAAGMSVYFSPFIVLLIGGLLTLVGGIVGSVSYNGASAIYGKFVKVLDGDQAGSLQQMYSEPQPQPQSQYVDPQAAYEPQDGQYVEPQPVYEQPEPQHAEYVEPQQQHAAEPVVAAPQESDEEIRRKAREEALAQMRAQQAERQARQQAQQQQAQPVQTGGDSSSVDEVIAKIDKIERDGAPREVMREVATLLQKERAKPENKTPERQKRLNEALSKLLKAMSGARK